MEPELFSMARRMWVEHEIVIHDGCSHRDCDGKRRAQFARQWDSENPRERVFEFIRRGFLAAAIVARPDLAEGLTVEEGHWASGVLPCR